MRWVVVGIALCGAAPAFALELRPEVSSFAYAATHFYTGMPFEYASAQELAPQVPQRADVDATDDEAAEVPTSPSFSRSDLCRTAADAAAENRIPVLVVDDADLAVARVLERLAPAVPRPAVGVDPGARVHPEARLGEGVAVGPLTQFSAFASTRAVLVFPVPRGPQKR